MKCSKVILQWDIRASDCTRGKTQKMESVLDMSDQFMSRHLSGKRLACMGKLFELKKQLAKINFEAYLIFALKNMTL